ncbi:hypothetical protein D3C87_1550410 [compost metagenome]
MYSPNALMKVRMAQTSMPLRANGRMMEKKAPTRELPSTSAASSSSRGTLMKVARTSTTKKGMALAAAARTTAVRGKFSRPTWLKPTNSGVTMTEAGNTCSISTQKSPISIQTLR